MTKSLTQTANITTGKLDSNAAIENGKYPFFTCAPEPLSIDSFSFDDDVILLAGNNAQGNFHISRYHGKFDAYQRTYVITAKEGYDIDYIKYSLEMSLQHLKRIAQGSQTKFLTMQILDGFMINDTPFKIQQSLIASVKAIDNKIALNKRINAELEAMAKTLYDYWFVQFDFPDESGKPYCSSGGAMVWNERLKREIPKGWCIEKIGALLAKVPNTLRIQTDGYNNVGGVPVIDQSTEFIAGYTDEKEAIISTDEGAIVFGDHTRIVKYVGFDFARGADGTQVLLSNNERMPQLMFYYSILKIDLSNYGYARHFKYLKDTFIILPDIKQAKAFHSTISPMQRTITRNIKENVELTTLRDWLLPMLMNGQATVE